MDWNRYALEMKSWLLSSYAASERKRGMRRSALGQSGIQNHGLSFCVVGIDNLSFERLDPFLDFFVNGENDGLARGHSSHSRSYTLLMNERKVSIHKGISVRMRDSL